MAVISGIIDFILFNLALSVVLFIFLRNIHVFWGIQARLIISTMHRNQTKITFFKAALFRVCDFFSSELSFPID